MVRRILCERCGPTSDLHRVDRERGWQMRRVNLVARKPAHHTITMIDGSHFVVTELESLCCDSCNEPIPDGTLCYAVTHWRSEFGEDPPCWENQYGTVLPAEAAQAARVLAASERNKQ